MIWKRKWWRVVARFVLCVLLIELWYGYVGWKYQSDRTSQIDDLEPVEVGLVLGASEKLPSGRDNLYFKFRVERAAEAWHAGKVTYLLVSGDNHVSHYNEPVDMRNALMKLGVPKDRILLDFAGFRTLDSIVRAKEVFGVSELLIISQPFHNERALYLANHYGIKAQGLDAQRISLRSGLRTAIRERFARIKMGLDVYVLKTEPKFLGEEVAWGN